MATRFGWPLPSAMFLIRASGSKSRLRLRSSFPPITTRRSDHSRDPRSSGCNPRSLLQSICTQIPQLSSLDVMKLAWYTRRIYAPNLRYPVRSDVVEQLFYVAPLICYAQTLKFAHDRLGKQSQLPRARNFPCYQARR